MYYVIVAAFMFVLPLLSIGTEARLAGNALPFALVGKWFVFWSVGVRLFTAGVRQVLQPEYTAREILGLKTDEPLLLVRELGFANLSIGLIALLALAFPAWRIPAALAGGLFYGLAGINHILQPHRNQLENVAMVSDLFISLVLFSVCVAAALSSAATKAPA